MNVREWALPVYTILMQLTVGSLFVLWMIRSLANSKFSHQEIDRIIRNPIIVIAFTAVVAMIGSHFHLSKPFHSFLAVLNFKSSWLSREIVFTVLFFLTTMSLLYLTYFRVHHRRLITTLGWLAILLGTILIYCMARIYLLPTQVAWNSSTVIVSFYTTSLVLGVMAIACLMVLDLKFAEIQKTDDVSLRVEVIRYLFGGLTLMTSLLVIVRILTLYLQMHQLSQGDLIARTSLRLLLELYQPLLILRVIVLLFAAIYFATSVYRILRSQLPPQNLMLPVYLSCLLILVGEILGRFLFYATHIRVGI
jgi:anaerobic dimethyl sulfoxide reductase subunit C (anchor subunit)